MSEQAYFLIGNKEDREVFSTCITEYNQSEIDTLTANGWLLVSKQTFDKAKQHVIRWTEDFTDVEPIPENDLATRFAAVEASYKAGLLTDGWNDTDRYKALRSKICFTVVDRGQLWYESLTEEQYLELQAWYKAWLDVTETKVIPEKPSWLK